MRHFVRPIFALSFAAFMVASAFPFVGCCSRCAPGKCQL